MKDIVAIITVGVIVFIIDIATAPKNYYKNLDNTVITALLIHHIINVYFQFGFLCSGFLLYGYLVTPLLVLLHWKTNDNKCALTEYVNEMNDLPDTEYLRDLWYFMGFKKLKNYDKLHKTYLFVAWLIALIRVISKHVSVSSH